MHDGALDTIDNRKREHPLSYERPRALVTCDRAIRSSVIALAIVSISPLLRERTEYVTNYSAHVRFIIGHADF